MQKKIYKVVRSGSVVEVYAYDSSPVTSLKTRSAKVCDGFAQRRADNVSAMRSRFKRIVWSLLKDNKEKPAFMTLTYGSPVFSLKDAYVDFRLAMYRFAREYPGFQYVAVPEFQQNGRVHFHLLVWGIPLFHVLTERETRYLADIWGNGFLDIIPTNGSNKLGSYMAKYMTKCAYDPRTYGQKAYTRNRNQQIEILQFWARELNVDKLNFVWYSGEYNTKYLGRGALFLYEVKQDDA